jgi:ribosomal protein S11
MKDKKDMAPRIAAGQAAKAQRRKEIKDWHVKTAYGRQRAKKKLFAAGRLCAQIINISKKKISSLILRPNYPPPHTQRLLENP